MEVERATRNGPLHRVARRSRTAERFGSERLPLFVGLGPLHVARPAASPPSARWILGQQSAGNSARQVIDTPCRGGSQFEWANDSVFQTVATLAAAKHSAVTRRDAI